MCRWWVVQQTEDGSWEKEEVGSAMTSMNIKGKPSFSVLARSQQLEVFQWNKKATLGNINLMSEEDLSC